MYGWIGVYIACTAVANATPVLRYSGSRVIAAPLERRTVAPVVSGTPSVVAIVEDPLLNRDSCTSTLVGSRELWTCRDTTSYPSDPSQFFWGSSASWTNFTSGGTPDIINGNLTCYGNNNNYAYFPPAADECPQSAGGGCPNGTRWLIWPDSPPLPVNELDEDIYLYTWIRNVYVNESNSDSLNGNPPTSLYRSDYSSSLSYDELPPVTLVDEEFYPAGQIAYGDYGWVLDGTTAYLYGAIANNGGIALAKTSTGSMEQISSYYYYHPTTGTWDQTAPSVTDTSQAIPNAGTGQQGTFYYSSYFGSYVWIGSPDYGDNSLFYITTAPDPTGPWATPTQFYSAPPGNEFSGYSQQAHPGLSDQGGNGKDIYLSYTLINSVNGQDYFVTQLVYVQWE